MLYNSSMSTRLSSVSKDSLPLPSAKSQKVSKFLYLGGALALIGAAGLLFVGLDHTGFFAEHSVEVLAHAGVYAGVSLVAMQLTIQKIGMVVAGTVLNKINQQSGLTQTILLGTLKNVREEKASLKVICQMLTNDAVLKSLKQFIENETPSLSQRCAYKILTNRGVQSVLALFGKRDQNSALPQDDTSETPPESRRLSDGTGRSSDGGSVGHLSRASLGGRLESSTGSSPSTPREMERWLQKHKQRAEILKELWEKLAAPGRAVGENSVEWIQKDVKRSFELLVQGFAGLSSDEERNSQLLSYIEVTGLFTALQEQIGAYSPNHIHPYIPKKLTPQTTPSSEAKVEDSPLENVPQEEKKQSSLLDHCKFVAETITYVGGVAFSFLANTARRWVSLQGERIKS